MRTVAGRLGHGGGGATTLRVYAAWLAEADQRAASGIGARMPARPAPEPAPAERAKTDPRTPAEHLAVELRRRVLTGQYSVGADLPPIKQLGADAGLSVGTVHRAVSLLKDWGLVEASRGRRARVIATEPASGPTVLRSTPDDSVPEAGAVPSVPPPAGPLLELEIRHHGEVFRRLSARADHRNPDILHRLLTGAIRRAGRDPSEVGDYEMDVRIGDQLITTFVDPGSL